ncbi:MAG TPA: hypothetical protein VJH04_01535 [archaeon]|nr:hypothetical protein [archaeon]
MIESTIKNFFEGILVVGILVLVLAFFFGQENLQVIVSQNLTQEIILSADSAATIPQPEVIGVTSFYDVTVKSTITATSRLTQPQNVIAIIRFKDHSVLAKVNGTKDFFTISPDKGRVQHTFHIGFSSEIPPITVWRGLYNGNLKEGHQILIRNDGGAVLVSTSINTRYGSILPDLIDYSDCRATFLLESGCGPGQVKYTDPMTGLNCEDEPANCQQSIDICSGTATVKISGEPDCASNKVETTIDYKYGEEFKAGELVYLSLWKDDACTQQSTDPKSLLVLCPKSRLGGEFTINAGILPGFDA